MRDLRRQRPTAKGWEMKTLLAAAENSEWRRRNCQPGSAAALGALEMALADMAVDLEIGAGRRARR